MFSWSSSLPIPIDLFEKMIRTRPLTTCFPEYTGENDTRSCLDYISEQYQSRLPPQHKPAIIHLIAARFKKDVQVGNTMQHNMMC